MADKAGLYDICKLIHIHLCAKGGADIQQNPALTYQPIVSAPPYRMILIISWEISLFLFYDFTSDSIRFFFPIESSPEGCHEI